MWTGKEDGGKEEAPGVEIQHTAVLWLAMKA